MATNATNGFDDYIVHSTYGSQGIIMLIANGLLFLTILLSRSLRRRKEMVIIAGMAAIDAIYGLSAISLAVYRFGILSRGQQNDKITPWDCVTLPPLFLIGISVQMTSVVNVVVSSDRLIAVAWPTKYRNLNVPYAGKLLGLLALFGVFSSAAMLLSTYFGTKNATTVTKMCTNPGIPYAYNLYQQTMIAGAGYLSVIIYFFVFLSYRRAVRNIAPSTNVIGEQHAVALQRRLTVTLGIITISTFIFFIIPYTIFAVCAWMNVVAPQPSLLATISRFSTIINVVIYMYRQKEMRSEMRALLTCTKPTRWTSSTGRTVVAR
uniref:G-protein coupled receptors family 1 profile domain-containing protein n=1 Tax=Plectus sambesii TaxID=2011161 RepID=A0A914X9U4_9BILA